MGRDISGRIQKFVKTARFLGDSWLKSKIVQWILPHVMEVFVENDHRDVEKMILANYPLVERDLPDGIKESLHSLGSNPETRRQYEEIVLATVTPENILEWMKEPDEWLDDDAPDGVREELELSAAVIEETPGGLEWLERQVMQLYAYADIVPQQTVAQSPGEPGVGD